MSTENIILVVLILLLIGALPSWPYSRSWGYGPSGLLSVLLLAWFLFGKGDSLGHNDLGLQNSGSSLSRDLKEAGHDIKRGVQDAVD